MKVVYILPASSGGIPHYTAELANATSKYAEVTVLKPKNLSDELFSDKVKTMDVFDPLVFSRGSFMKIFSLRNVINLSSLRNIKAVDQIKPDVIHFPELYPHSAFFTFLCGIDKKYPTIVTLHSTFESFFSLLLNTKDIIYSLSASMADLMRRLIKVNKIIVHTDNDRNTLIKKGVDPDKIIVIPHGAYSIFKKYESPSITKEENCALFFGYIIRQKGLEYLIKAAPVVAKEIPDFKVVIAGEGNLSKYLRLIHDSSRFEIYNDFIPNEVVARLFQRAKVVVLPYTYHGGHSGVLTIAFSFGKPVVVTDVGSFPELVEDKGEGLIVPSKDTKALAEAIIKLLKDEGLRERMKRNALRKAEEFSWDNVAKMHMKVYEGVLNEWRKNHGTHLGAQFSR